MPPPAPAPRTPTIPFPDQETVTVAELLAALGDSAQALHDVPAVRRDYESLLGAHHLAPDQIPYDQYLVVRVVFEATRDGGLWGLVWDITNRIGHSDAIWQQWQSAPVPQDNEWGRTATAECDELSALFAFFVRRLGVPHAGFLGGGPMHIVGHWTLPLPGREVRVVVPTSQVFLSREATLGTREINAYSARKVWDYWRTDVPLTSTIPAPLARYFVRRLALTSRPHAELQQLRNQHGGS